MMRQAPPSRAWEILDELGRHSSSREDEAVRRLRRLPPRALPDLIAALRLHPNAYGRAAAARALAKFGPRAAPALLPALRDPAMPVRLYALLSLERMWSPKMASPGIRHNAAVVLGRRSATAATRRLIQALDDPAWHVRQQAARALGRLRFQAARGALVRASVDPRRAVRGAAQGALARMSCSGVKG